MCGDFGVECAEVVDAEVAEAAVSGDAGEGLELVLRDAQEIGDALRALLDLQAAAQGRVLGSDAHGAFAGLADAVLLTGKRLSLIHI